MQSLAISTLTICGIDELPSHSIRRVTHVLSLLDPDRAELDTFGTYGEHHRVTLRFHDILGPSQGMTHPQPRHVEQILGFGESLKDGVTERVEGHLLVHCHMGISRSTAAMLMLMAQNDTEATEDELFARLREVRPQAWPNSIMIGFADEQLGRGGRLTEALRRHYGHQLKVQPQYTDWMTRLGRTSELDMAL
ncbi:tyrosine phosphatase family protein [Bosea sp. PAMC 26642]|uniref:tyrosine phosphatase family protein n=1 Tax=Bosea sp. (strain PAMC 26642) TaxID=1792307 RepID=UPI0007700303|nr:dual specificity protein phosphatase family protein [Bosea sp. PAMC 26642]AMJ61653.1 protein-tyrosine-phosphatase [Bosea sp. PAMC 26642]